MSGSRNGYLGKVSRFTFRGLVPRASWACTGADWFTRPFSFQFGPVVVPLSPFFFETWSRSGVRPPGISHRPSSFTPNLSRVPVTQSSRHSASMFLKRGGVIQFLLHLSTPFFFQPHYPFPPKNASLSGFSSYWKRRPLLCFFLFYPRWYRTDSALRQQLPGRSFSPDKAERPPISSSHSSPFFLFIHQIRDCLRRHRLVLCSNRS